jgi:glycosidase
MPPAASCFQRLQRFHRALGLTLLLATAAAVAGATPPAQRPAAAPGLRLRVPSPDWRDQVIYFVMTDRFADGNPANNDQGVGAYNPQRSDRFNGGDLQGIRQRLDYIQGLGATAVWITPPNRNQWFDPLLGYYGYHGYWAQHFKQVDPHVGTLADYRRLSDALHRRGMYLVQDIVVNHTANYFDYTGGWDPQDPARFYAPNPRSLPTPAPTQWPFSLNDPRRADHRRAGIYHWTPPLIDVADREQELRFQMSGLDDLNTRNPTVRRALRDSFGWWIQAVGVDAYRVDTAFYVEPEFFEDFIHSRDRRAPGLAHVARRTGREDFLVFGEGFGIDRAGEERQSRRIESYVTGPKGERRMNGMLNFPLYGALQDVFARGRPAAELADRIERMLKVHRDIHRMPSFIDNHDVDRWLAGADEASLKQALLAMMTLPGIPVLYYGTEQGFTEQRAAMFAAAQGSGGRDRYDTQSPLYRWTAEAVSLRRAHRVFSRGVPELLQASRSGPGVLAWQTRWQASPAQADDALVIFNTADHALLVDNLAPRAEPGSRWQLLLVLPGSAEPAGAAAVPRVGDTLLLPPDGRLNLTLGPRGAQVWKRVPGPAATAARTVALPAIPPTAPLTLDPLPPLPPGGYPGDVAVSGRAAPGEQLQLVVDGDLDRALSVSADTEGRWRASVDTRRMIDPSPVHRVVALRRGPASAQPSGTPGLTLQTSQPLTFQVQLPWRRLIDVDDPAGDDHGLDGQIRYPNHASFERGQMDITHTVVEQAGGALRISLRMGAHSQVWGPPNGFDHVAFTLFIELPQGDGAPLPEGAEVMPDQDARLPQGMRWHLRLRAHGWTNAMFSAEGASASSDGRPVSPAALVTTDRATRTVTFTVPSAALGDRLQLSGARLYITTWDYDGGYRALAREPGPFIFGGPPGSAKVIDAVGPLRLP